MAHYRGSIYFKTIRGGFSESFYYEGSQLNAVYARVANLRAARIGLLPPASTIIGIRVQNVDKPGESTVATGNYPGTSYPTDVPNISLVTLAYTGGAAKRALFIRNIPDNQVTNGLYLPGIGFGGLVANYLNAIRDNGCQLRIVNRTPELKVYDTVSGTGLVTLSVAHGIAPQTTVKFYRSSFADGSPIRGTFSVRETPTSSSIQLGNWEAGKTAARGRLRSFLYDYAAITSFEQGYRVRTHKLGRPFDTPVGRSSARR